MTFDEIANALTPEMLKKLADASDLALVPQRVFRSVCDSMLSKHVRPPTKKMLGTKLRTSKWFAITEQGLQELLSESHGVPTATEEGHEGKMSIRRDEEGRVKPTRETATHSVGPDR